MKIKYILWLFICIIGLISCDKEEDDGSRAFMDVATITGDSINGYFCYLNSGGLAVSHNRWLASKEGISLSITPRTIGRRRPTGLRTSIMPVSFLIQSMKYSVPSASKKPKAGTSPTPIAVRCLSFCPSDAGIAAISISVPASPW